MICIWILYLDKDKHMLMHVENKSEKKNHFLEVI